MSFGYNCKFILYFSPQRVFHRLGEEAFKNFGLKLCKIIAETNGNNVIPIALGHIQKEFNIKGNFIDNESSIATNWCKPFLENVDTINAYISFEGGGPNSKVWQLFDAIIREHYSDTNGRPLIHMDVLSYDFKNFEFINTNPNRWKDYQYAVNDMDGLWKNPRIGCKADLHQYVEYEYKPDAWYELYLEIDTVEALAYLINTFFVNVNINLFRYKNSIERSVKNV